MAYIGNSSTTQSFTPAIDYFSGNGSTTAFTLSRPVASAAQVMVVVNNVPQHPTTAFSVSGNTITFTGAPSTGTNNIYVMYTTLNQQVVQPGQGTVGTSQLVDSAVTAAKIASGQTFSLNGITFPATQVSSADANTLDDYEEGTWTPALNGGSPAYSIQGGRYTKVGNLVTVWAMITITSKSSSPNEAAITGLPFASAASLGGLYPITGCIGRTYSPSGLMPNQNANFVSVEGVNAYIRYPNGINSSLGMDNLASSGGIGLYASYYTT